MKLPRTTLILILLALSLGSFVYFYEIKGKTQREQVKEQNQQIFSFTADDVQSLTIKTQKLNLTLERSGEGSQPKWLLKSPISEPANDAIVSFLMDLLVAAKKVDTNNQPGGSLPSQVGSSSVVKHRALSVPENQKAEFGLDKPQATINITLKNQKSHQLILGKPDFNRRFLYAQVDPIVKPDGNVEVLLVSPDLENAVNRELSEWKQPTDNNLKQSTPSPQPSNQGGTQKGKDTEKR